MPSCTRLLFQRLYRSLIMVTVLSLPLFKANSALANGVTNQPGGAGNPMWSIGRAKPAQAPLQFVFSVFSWAKTWGGTGDDFGQAPAVDGSGNIYVSGYFNDTVDFDPGSGVDSHISNGGRDVFLTKFDPSGNFLWARTWGGSGDDRGESIALDGSGNIYVTGPFRATADFNPGSGVDSHTAPGTENDAFLSKFDASGNFQWAKTWGGATGDEAYSVAVDGSGYAYVVGDFSSPTVDFDPGAGVDNHINHGFFDAFLTKFASDGTFQWAKTWGGEGYDDGPGVAVDSLGNIYVGGMYASTDPNLNFDPAGGVGGLGHQSQNSGILVDVFLSKFASNGTFQWVRTWGAIGTDEVGQTVVVDKLNNVYVGGRFGCLNCDFDPGVGTNLHSSNGDLDAFVSKFDAGGNFQWAKTWGGTGWDAVGGLAVDGSNNLYVTGLFKNTVDFGSGASISSNGSLDAFLSKFSSTGTFQGVKTWGGSGNDSGNRLALNAEGNVYVAGWFQHTVDFNPGGITDAHTSNGAADSYLSIFYDAITNPPGLSVSGINIVANGRIVRLHGANMGDPFWARGWYGSTYSPNDYYLLSHDWRANVVRISIFPTQWKNMDHATLLAGLAQDVNAALNNGMYVIISYHVIGWPNGFYQSACCGNPADTYDSSMSIATSFWAQMAQTYGSDTRIIFDLWNEPVHPDDFTLYGSTPNPLWPTLKGFYESLIQTVRTNGAQNIVIATGNRWSSWLVGIKDDPLTDSNVVYAYHKYSVNGSNTAAEWDKDTGGLIGIKPVLVSEWGYEDSDVPNPTWAGSQSSYGDPFTQWMDDNNLSSLAWMYHHDWTPALLKGNGSLTLYGTYARNYIGTSSYQDTATTDTWALQVSPAANINQLATQFGAQNLGQIGSLTGYYLFRVPGSVTQSATVASLLGANSNVLWFEQQVARGQSKREDADPISPYPSQENLADVTTVTTEAVTADGMNFQDNFSDSSSGYTPQAASSPGPSQTAITITESFPTTTEPCTAVPTQTNTSPITSTSPIPAQTTIAQRPQASIPTRLVQSAKIAALPNEPSLIPTPMIRSIPQSTESENNSSNGASLTAVMITLSLAAGGILLSMRWKK